MKLVAFLLLITATALFPTLPQEVELPQSVGTEQHAWLLELVGEWEATSEMAAQEGQEPVRWESRETIRALGDLWIIAEGSIPGSTESFASMMTLGYDSDQRAFVGTWIDNMQTRMWSYRGALDKEQRVLTLEAEGPSMEDPSKTALYRDQLERVGPDHKRMISSVLGEDGEWLRFMTVEYHRKK